MNIDNLASLWFTQIDLSIDKIFDFLGSDTVTAGYALQYENFEIDKYYLDNLHGKPSVEFLGALFYNPVASPAKTIVLGNAGSWGTLSNYICKKVSSWNYQFDMNDEKSKVPRNTLMFNESGRSLRFVQSMFSDEDDKWQFSEKGNPLWFEKTEYYARPEIHLRLNKDILVEYCEKLELSLKQDDFFRSEKKALFVKHATGKNAKR
jgi:hypothetical protein